MATKKTVKSKTSSRKVASVKKASRKSPSVKKASVKKVTKKASAVKATPAKKAPASKKASTRKTLSKKASAPSKTTAKKSASKKAPTTKRPAKKVASSKTTVKKPSQKQRETTIAPATKKAGTSAVASTKGKSKGRKSQELGSSRSASKSSRKSSAADNALTQQHALIAKGIAERKAAAKAKSLALMNRPAVEKNKRRKKITARQAKEYETMLLRLRDEISRQIAYLRGASLTRADEVNPEEDGTDAFERQLALKLASEEGDAIFEIDEALHRIKEETYGVCEDCQCVISPARLKALPFARRCVSCKAEAEKNNHSNNRRYF